MTEAVTTDELLRLRLATQRIAPVTRGAVLDTVRHLLAIQAQDFLQALWAVGSRTAGSTRSDILAALERGEIVRSLPMRGTLHFVPAEDLGWMLSLTAQRTLRSNATRFRTLGLDQATLDRSVEVVTTALRGGGALARADLMTLLADAGISPDGQRTYHLIFYLSQLGLVCWGPPSGTQQALVLVDEWIPRPRRFERVEALREFALRYFTGHGPATLRDFAWWTKLTLADARTAVGAAAAELTELTHDGSSYWIATSELDAAASVAPASESAAVQALAGFDEYLLGYRDRSLALAAEHSERIVPGNNGMFLPIIVDHGRVTGTWHKAQGSTPGSVVAEHFVAPTKPHQAAFERAALAYSRFMAG